VHRALRHAVGDGAAVGVLHDEVRPFVVRLPHVEDLHDSAGRRLAQQPCLGEESFADVDAVGPVFGHHLDRDGGFEPVVEGQPHDSEGARAKASVHSVPADLIR
jgi:hypothetical protein